MSSAEAVGEALRPPADHENGVPVDDDPDRFMAWCLRSRTSLCAVFVVVVGIAKYGIGLYPSWNYFVAFARNWKAPEVSFLLETTASYRLDSPTAAVLAGMLHITSGPTYLGYSFVLACGAIVTPFLMPSVRRSAELRLTVVLLLVGGAVPAVLLDWVGSYDPVTIAAGAVIGLAESPVTVLVAWVVLAFDNSGQAGFALGIVALVLFAARRRESITRIAVCCIGAAIGYLDIRLVTNLWGGAISQVTLFKLYGLPRFARSTFHYWPLIIVGAIGVGWVFLASKEIRKFPEAKVMIALAGLACVTVPFVALDSTRVIAGILWPPLLLTARMTIPKVSVHDVHKLLRRLAPVALLLPIVLVWDNSLVYPGWQAIGSFVSYIFGHAHIPAAPS